MTKMLPREPSCNFLIPQGLWVQLGLKNTMTILRHFLKPSNLNLNNNKLNQQNKPRKIKLNSNHTKRQDFC